MDVVVGINGLTTDDEIKPLVEAGAEEFYMGYIPEYWSGRFGWEIAPNRRPYHEYNYLSLESLSAAKDSVKRFGKKALLAVNEHEYPPERMSEAVRMVRECVSLGFDAVIISNIALALEIREAGIDVPFHISIGGLVNNYEAVKFYKKHIPGIRRFILPRDLTVREIRSFALKSKDDDISLEAFGVGDPCAWSDGYCLAWHSAGIAPFCSWFFTGDRKLTDLRSFFDWRDKIRSGDISFVDSVEPIKARAKFGGFKPSSERDDFLADIVRVCGLCAIPLFKKWGIDAIKVPARGGEKRDAVIDLVTRAMAAESPEECKALIGSEEFCAGSRCYYNYPSEKDV